MGRWSANIAKKQCCRAQLIETIFPAGRYGFTWEAQLEAGLRSGKVFSSDTARWYGVPEEFTVNSAEMGCAVDAASDALLCLRARMREPTEALVCRVMVSSVCVHTAPLTRDAARLQIQTEARVRQALHAVWATGLTVTIQGVLKEETADAKAFLDKIQPVLGRQRRVTVTLPPISQYAAVEENRNATIRAPKAYASLAAGSGITF